MARAECFNENWRKTGKDPELTNGKIYEIVNYVENIYDPCITIIGDLGTEIERPKWAFCIYL